MRNLIGWLPTATRILLGLIFFVFGLNGFLNFLPHPSLGGAAGLFVGGLLASGYFFPLLKGTEVLAGLALLSGRFVPLALTVLAPIIINIAAFHFVLAPAGVGLAVVLLASEIFLAWAYRESFRGVLQPDAKPIVGEAAATAPSTAHVVA